MSRSLLLSSLLIIGVLFMGSSESQTKVLIWPNGAKVAINLSYDDALNSHLDNAVPALDKYGFKGSFYVLPNRLEMYERMDEWRAIANNGHELGNHSIYHPCRASLPDRNWVRPHHDLDKYSVEQMVGEVLTANTFLHAIDGKKERTFTPPCNETEAGGKSYIEEIQSHFVGIKGLGIESGFEVAWGPSDVTGEQLIEYIQQVPDGVSVINIVFHGIGGDYLTVSNEAHEQLLKFLFENKSQFYVDSYLNIMKLKNQQSL